MKYNQFNEIIFSLCIAYEWLTFHSRLIETSTYRDKGFRDPIYPLARRFHHNKMSIFFCLSVLLRVLSSTTFAFFLCHSYVIPHTAMLEEIYSQSMCVENSRRLKKVQTTVGTSAGIVDFNWLPYSRHTVFQRSLETHVFITVPAAVAIASKNVIFVAHELRFVVSIPLEEFDSEFYLQTFL